MHSRPSPPNAGCSGAFAASRMYQPSHSRTSSCQPLRPRPTADYTHSKSTNRYIVHCLMCAGVHEARIFEKAAWLLFHSFQHLYFSEFFSVSRRHSSFIT